MHVSWLAKRRCEKNKNFVEIISVTLCNYLFKKFIENLETKSIAVVQWLWFFLYPSANPWHYEWLRVFESPAHPEQFVLVKTRRDYLEADR